MIETMAVLSLLGFPDPAALAQSNEELNGSFQFNFYTPGARSLALGRAFTARADDATAAYANPAGLLWISELDVALEVRNSGFTTIHVDGGRANGVPTGLGIDTSDRPIFSQTERDTTGLSFISVVLPVHKDWRIAVYRHELANFKAAIDRSEGIFFALPRQRPGRVNHGRVDPVQAELDLDLVNFGISGAYRISKKLWAGVGLSYYDFEMNSVWEGFEQRDPARPTDISFEPATFSGANSLGTRIHRGEDSDLAVNAGLLAKTLDGRWTFGLVYRQGPKVDFEVEVWRRQIADDGIFTAAPCGQLTDPPIIPCGELNPERSGPGRFHAPDVYSVGVTFRPKKADKWIFSFEYDRVTYSNLKPSINVLAIAQEPEVSLSEFEIEDGDEYHVGIERVIETPKIDFSLRAGVWEDPAHQLRWTDREPLSTVVVGGEVKPTNDAVRLAVRFPGADDEIHWTGGFGWSTERVWIDAGFDLSDRGDVFSLTAGFRLPKWKR